MDLCWMVQAEPKSYGVEIVINGVTLLIRLIFSSGSCIDLRNETFQKWQITFYKAVFLIFVGAHHGLILEFYLL